MRKRLAAKITGVAGYVPPRLLTNADLERMVDTTDEWIQQRVGIRERHIVDKGMAPHTWQRQPRSSFWKRPTPPLKRST